MKKLFIVEEQSLPYNAKTPVGKYAWTRGSTKDLLLHEALPWAVSEGAPLQELDGAVLIRAGLHEARKHDSDRSLDGSNLYQVVNTLLVAHRSKGGWTVSYCRLPNSDEGVKLAEQGYKLNKNNQKLVVPLDDKVLRAMTDEAQKHGRVVPALDTNELKLDLKRDYARHPHMIAAFGGKEHGRKVAAVNAAYLQDRKCDFGYLWQLNVADLEKILPNNDPSAQTHAVVRRVGLGGDLYDVIDSVSANGSFSSYGRARGGTSCTREISSGNKGRVVVSAK